MNEDQIIKTLMGNAKTPKLVPNGLVEGQVKQFLELALKANTEQIKAMLTTLQGELKKRELLRGEGAP